ncbi:MAG: FkbM family methyltransferase [Chloroflexaceae bacterium]|nr:FkbM family methyltransferase [Chloroflexaceae bacterium]
MKQVFFDLYRMLFARRRFAALHRALVLLGLKGLGFLNSDSPRFSGEVAFLRNLLRIAPAEQLTVLDVGAHVGGYASAVKNLAPHATVYAFEPHPRTFERLQQAATQQGFQAVHAGCGAESGQQQLYDYATGDGSTHASLYREVIEVSHRQQAVARKVQVLALDDFASTHNLAAVHLLKIDTEGNELQVLHGCQRMLQQAMIDVIQFEFGPMNVISRVFFRDFYALLPGYCFYHMLPNELVTIDLYDSLFCELFVYHNVVAVRQDCVWAAALQIRGSMA